jgi:hypothetical protein
MHFLVMRGSRKKGAADRVRGASGIRAVGATGSHRSSRHAADRCDPNKEGKQEDLDDEDERQRHVGLTWMREVKSSGRERHDVRSG